MSLLRNLHISRIRGSSRRYEPWICRSRKPRSNRIIDIHFWCDGDDSVCKQQCPRGMGIPYGGNYAAAASVVNPLNVRLEPSFTGVNIATLNFRDVIALDKTGGTVVAAGMPFVREDTHRRGWLGRKNGARRRRTTCRVSIQPKRIRPCWN